MRRCIQKLIKTHHTCNLWFTLQRNISHTMITTFTQEKCILSVNQNLTFMALKLKNRVKNYKIVKRTQSKDKS